MHCAVTTLETRRRESRLLTLIQYGTKSAAPASTFNRKITVYLDCLTRPGGPKKFTITTPTEQLVIFLLAFDLEAVTLS